jgi:hypothetical protein
VNHAWRVLLSKSPPLQSVVERYPRATHTLSWSMTFLAVVVAWVVFRAESFTGFAHMLQGMFLDAQSVDAAVADAQTVYYIGIGLLIAFVAPNSQELLTGIGERLVAVGRPSLRPFYQGAHAGAILMIIASLTVISLSWGINEFIYFNF